jgi:hypothetical protein
VGVKTDAYRVVMGKSEEKKQLGRCKRRWEDNIIIDVKEIG